jgi:hypothetical protein
MFNTFVIFPCMIKKFGLLMLSWTCWKRFCSAWRVDL